MEFWGGISGLGFWVRNFGTGILGLGSGTGIWSWDFGVGIPGLGFWGQNCEVGMLGKDFTVRNLGVEI